MRSPFVEGKTCQQPGEPSSRTSAEWAGWDWDEVRQQWTWDAEEAESRYGRWTEDRPEGPWLTFSWLSARALLDSVNDQIAKKIGDLVDPRRQRWIAAQRAAGHNPDQVLAAPGPSLLIVGDPGEIDDSQFAVIPPLLQIHEKKRSDFLVVLSDVIYPDGEIDLYVPGFYDAFRKYTNPTYALPGNHDWYDGLNGFMWNFCGAEALPPTQYRSASFTASERVARALWRRAGRPDRPQLLSRRSPEGKVWKPRQPGPYWAMDIDNPKGEDVRLIAIDTGITGGLDREQGEWLLRMADDTEGSTRKPMPKVLLTGKPLWVDGKYDPGEIHWGMGNPALRDMETVDDVVRAPLHNFRAAIGGDIHNYQRLTVTIDKDTGRQIEYVVTGGGGAYLSDTQSIRLQPPWHRRKPKPPYDELPEGVVPPREENFRCYPTRADCVAYYTRWYGQRVFRICLTAVVLAVAAFMVLLEWDIGGSELDRQNVHEVAGVAVAGVACLAAPGALAGLFASFYRRGSHATAFLLIAPVLYAVAAWAGSTIFGGDWGWMWQSAVIGAGVLLLPLVMIVLIYYRFSTPQRRRLGLALLCVLAGGLLFARFDDSTSTFISVVAGISVLALLLRFIEAISRSDEDISARHRPRDPLLSAPLVILAYHVLIAAALIRFDGAWALKAAIAAELGIIATLGLLLPLLVVLGSGLAVLSMWNGRIDPNDALAALEDMREIEEVLPENQRRVGNADDRRTRRIVKFLTAPSGVRKWARLGLAQIGNADQPPMFKNFVHAAISDDGQALELSCYGVTGWRKHEQPSQVPREDCVRVELSHPAGPAPA